MAVYRRYKSLPKMFHTQLLEDTSNCFVGTYRAHLLPMMIWKVDLVKQYTNLHAHVVFLHDIRSILLFLWCLPKYISKLPVFPMNVHLQSGLVLQFTVAFSHDYRQNVHHTAPFWGSFELGILTILYLEQVQKCQSFGTYICYHYAVPHRDLASAQA